MAQAMREVRSMAFEIAHSQFQLENLSPGRRLAALLLGLAFLAGLAWCCVTAYNAQPLDAQQEAKSESVHR
jgi:hypothetical protein